MRLALLLFPAMTPSSCPGGRDGSPCFARIHAQGAYKKEGSAVGVNTPSRVNVRSIQAHWRIRSSMQWMELPPLGVVLDRVQ